MTLPKQPDRGEYTIQQLEESAERLLREMLAKGGNQPSEEAVKMASRYLANKAMRESNAKRD